MEFLVLGPVAVSAGGSEVVIPAGMQVRVLALLLAEPHHGLTAATLIDQLWPGRPPRTARKTVQVYIHLLRRALGGDTAIVHTSGRYHLSEQHSDALTFRS